MDGQMEQAQNSYDQYLVEQKAMRERAQAELRQLAGEIAGKLGAGWKLRETNDDDCWYRWNEIEYSEKCSNGAIKADCSLHITKNKQGRKEFYHISGGRVSNQQGGMTTFPDFAINVSAEKSAEQIARDIQRRMLDKGYFKAFDEAVEKARGVNQRDDDRWSATQELAAIIGYSFVGREPENRQASLHWYHREGARGCGEVRINSTDSIDLKISCGKATARKILELIASLG